MSPEPCIRRPGSYWTTCSCADCHNDRLLTHRRYNGGLPWRVPSEQAWIILADLIDRGWTARAISSATGLSPFMFGEHLARYRATGERVHLAPRTAAAIVNMGKPTDGQIGATVARRKLEALAVMGWGLRELAVETGIGFSTLGMIRTRNERLKVAAADAIDVAYDRLHMKRGPSAEAARMARDKKWPGPLAFDDIDDIDEQPKHNVKGTNDSFELRKRLDMAVVWRLVDEGIRVRQLSSAEAAEAYRILRTTGLSPTEIEIKYRLRPARYKKGDAA